ncbi:MAG: alanyl-tRNA editing protein [Rhodospirillales bacterium]|nr:alanyl-tRNA editing protein [Rhodospirillales bacterium]
MTERLFLADPRATCVAAHVVGVGAEGVVLDRTVFYARSGGQPGDRGVLRWDGGETPISEAIKGEGETILHVPAPGAALPPAGAPVEAEIDWPRRHRLMRMHTSLHLLCCLLPGAGVTGGQVGEERSRLDFDLRQSPDRAALEEGFKALIAADHPVRAEWVEESLLDSSPDLVRTLSVKPPRGTGRLRLVRIGAKEPPIDLQPCGGTHVSSTAEIGRLAVQKIENKGRQNRRVAIALVE